MMSIPYLHDGTEYIINMENVSCIQMEPWYRSDGKEGGDRIQIYFRNDRPNFITTYEGDEGKKMFETCLNYIMKGTEYKRGDFRHSRWLKLRGKALINTAAVDFVSFSPASWTLGMFIRLHLTGDGFVDITYSEKETDEFVADKEMLYGEMNVATGITRGGYSVNAPHS